MEEVIQRSQEYSAAKNVIKGCIKDTKQNFIYIGHYLKEIRDNRLYQEDGYPDFDAFMAIEIGKDKGWASRCINVASQFGIMENGQPTLAEGYQDYSLSLLIEMVAMTPEQRELVTPDTEVKQAREIKKADKEKSCESQLEGEERAAHVKEQYRLQDSFLRPFAIWLIKGHKDWFLEDTMKRVTLVDQSERQMKSYFGVDQSGSIQFGFPVDGGTYYARLYDNRIEISHYSDTGEVEVDGSSEWFYFAASIQSQWNNVALEEARAQRAEESRRQAGEELVPTEPEKSEWVNPEGEQVDESYSLAGIPRASDRHINMLARMLVQDRVQQLVSGSTVNPDDYWVKEQIRRYSLSKHNLIEIGDDVIAYAALEVIEFYREDEDLGICLYPKFANRVRTQLDEYAQEQAAAKKERETTPEQPDENETDQETIVDAEFEEVPETEEYTPQFFLKEQNAKLDRLLWSTKGKELSQTDNKVIEQQKTIVAALASMVNALERIELKEQLEAEKLVQPELPVLKNNDQRAAFVDNYETWPLWIETKETGERYYRYDLSDGTSMVVKVYHAMLFDYEATGLPYKDRHKEGYGRHEYYLLKEGKFFRDCETNRSALIEKLKDIQKKGKG